ncbi:MAG: hypothetical protein ACOH18_01750 [Candidatus Saccharimonadaceae bacterium]
MEPSKSKTLRDWFYWLAAAIVYASIGAIMMYLVPVLYGGDSSDFRYAGLLFILIGLYMLLIFSVVGPKRLAYYRIEKLLEEKTNGGSRVFAGTTPAGTHLQLSPPKKPSQMYILTEISPDGDWLGHFVISMHSTTQSGSMVRSDKHYLYSASDYRKLIIWLQENFEVLETSTA